MKKRNLGREAVEEAVEETLADAKIKADIEKRLKKNIGKTVSTGSTVLDLEISGGRTREGGIPGGIILEIYGPSSSGKTAILSEIGASALIRGGQVKFQDPEARLDKEYARIYGLSLSKKDGYERPDTVKEMFSGIQEWQPKDLKKINVVCTDSLAALSTEMEMADEDKMGMKRAKDFHQGFRKTARIIANTNLLVACSNQLHNTKFGEVTPGGKSIPYWSSLRMRVMQEKLIDVERTVRDVKVKGSIGIKSNVYIKKSSVDNPFRTASIYIVFGLGIDDVRGNLQWYKNITKGTKYYCISKDYVSMNNAIRYIEKHDLQDALREEVIKLWHEIQEEFKMKRTPKKRR